MKTVIKSKLKEIEYPVVYLCLIFFSLLTWYFIIKAVFYYIGLVL